MVGGPYSLRCTWRSILDEPDKVPLSAPHETNRRFRGDLRKFFESCCFFATLEQMCRHREDASAEVLSDRYKMEALRFAWLYKPTHHPDLWRTSDQIRKCLWLTSKLRKRPIKNAADYFHQAA